MRFTPVLYTHVCSRRFKPRIELSDMREGEMVGLSAVASAQCLHQRRFAKDCPECRRDDHPHSITTFNQLQVRHDGFRSPKLDSWYRVSVNKVLIHSCCPVYHSTDKLCARQNPFGGVEISK